MSLVTQLLVSFGIPARRDEAAERLAARIGCDSVVLFAPDIETRTLVPVTTFDAKEGLAREWRQALSMANVDSPAVMLRHPRTGELTSVLIRRADDGSVLAAMGGRPHPARIEWAVRVVPVMSAIARSEQARGIARAHANAARHLAERHERLGTRVDALIQQLHEARDEAANAKRDAEEAKERAATANRLKDDFLTMLSHELRTPLNAMIGWIQMVRLHRHDEPIRQRALEIIERNARAQTQIVTDLLDVSRIITGKLRLRLTRVDLRDIVHGGCDSLRPTLEAKNLTLTIETADVPGVVVGDSDRLHQVVWNLVSNAAKFTPPGGRIEVRLEAANGFASITVRDTGVGIQREFVPYVFERFRQWDSGVTRAHGGLGLGLAIVRHLVELHGGAVAAESDGENRGATFTVRLPYRDTDEVTSPRSEVKSEDQKSEALASNF